MAVGETLSPVVAIPLTFPIIGYFLGENYIYIFLKILKGKYPFFIVKYREWQKKKKSERERE